MANELSGGGQPSDHGTITPLTNPSLDPIPITFVQRQGLHCVYYSPEPLPPGTPVRQDVEFRRRWDHMQQHTGQHLLSAIMNKYNDLETLGWGMGAENDMSYVDVPRKPSEDEMQSIQEKCNAAIGQNIGITVENPDNVKLDKLPDDYDKERGIIRVVKIGNLDANTYVRPLSNIFLNRLTEHNRCCGTHLRQTSHISLLLLGSTQSVHSTNCRLSFIAGDRAINLATSSIHSIRSIARLVSSGTTPAEVLASVNKMKETATELKRTETRLLTDIAKYEADRVKAVLSTGMNAFVYRAVQGLDFINMVVPQVKEAVKEGAVTVLASGEGSKGGQIVIIGDKNSVEGFATKVKEVIPGIKGGGRGERWQGKVIEWRKGELEALKKLVG